MPPRAARLWEGHLRVSSDLLGRPLGKRRYSTISLLRLWTNATTSRCSASGTWHFARVATAWPRNATRLADLLKEHGSAMQSKARRVSQPAALPERLVVIRPRDAGLGVVGHGDGRRRPRCTRTCGWGRRSTPPMPATRRSRRRKSSRRRGPRLTGAREDGAFKGPTWPRSFTSPRRSVTAEGSGRITPRRAPGRGRRSGRRRPRCRRHSGRASP